MVSLVVPPLFLAYRSQAFDFSKVQPVNPDRDFTHAENNVVTEVYGYGQKIERKGSCVIVYVKDKEGEWKGTALRDEREGQLIVEEGWKLAIGGGKFLEVPN
jgi:hypothetical protein